MANTREPTFRLGVRRRSSEAARASELVVNGYKHAGGYDPWTGKELWRLGGGGDIPVPTPVVAHGLVFLSSSHGQQRPLCAVREGATGDITPAKETELGDHLAWYLPRAGIYMQTPIVDGDYLYACNDNGALNCYEAQTGKSVYRRRLGNGSTGFTASAVAGDGKLYFTSENGEIYVVQSGPTFNLLATNAMNETCMATPAISDGMLIVRTEGHVYAIGSPPDQAMNKPRQQADQSSVQVEGIAVCEDDLNRRPVRPHVSARIHLSSSDETLLRGKLSWLTPR